MYSRPSFWVIMIASWNVFDSLFQGMADFQSGSVWMVVLMTRPEGPPVAKNKLSWLINLSRCQKPLQENICDMNFMYLRAEASRLMSPKEQGYSGILMHLQQ